MPLARRRSSSEKPKAKAAPKARASLQNSVEEFLNRFRVFLARSCTCFSNFNTAFKFVLKGECRVFSVLQGFIVDCGIHFRVLLNFDRFVGSRLRVFALRSLE